MKVNIYQPVKEYCVSNIGECLMCRSSNDLSIAIMNVNKGEYYIDCEKTSNIQRKLQCVSQNDSVRLFREDDKCLVMVTLIYQNQSHIVHGNLDTGADCSLAGIKLLEELFPGKKFNFEGTCIKLKAANDRPIQCVGTMNLVCRIGQSERPVWSSSRVRRTCVEPCGHGGQ